MVTRWAHEETTNAKTDTRHALSYGAPFVVTRVVLG